MTTIPHPEESSAALDELIERCRRSERAAQGQFYGLFRTQVATILHRVLGPQPANLDDAVQEVFLAVFRSITKFRGDARISTWLYRVCVNVSLQILRKRYHTIETCDEVTAEASDHRTPDRDLDARRRVAAMYRTLDQLSTKKRIVFVLHEIEGCPPCEIAELVGAPVLTVRTRLHYARKEFFARARRDATLNDLVPDDQRGAGTVMPGSGRSDAAVGQPSRAMQSTRPAHSGLPCSPRRVNMFV